MIFFFFFRKVVQTHRQVFLLLKHVITIGHYRMAKKFLSLFSSPIKKKKSAAPSNTFHSLAPLLLAGFCFHFLFFKIEQSQQHLIQLNKEIFILNFLFYKVEQSNNISPSSINKFSFSIFFFFTR